MAQGQIPTYKFIQTVQSKGNCKNGDNLGMLISDTSMMYHMNKVSKDKMTFYYLCSKRKSTGCTASAIVNKLIINEGGIKGERHVVKKCAALEDHNHEGDQAELLAERIYLEMAEKAQVFKNSRF